MSDTQGAPAGPEPQMPVPEFYKNVPVVDLRPSERGDGFSLFGALSRRVVLRVALAAVALFALFLVQDGYADRRAAEGRVAELASEIGRAEGRLAEAQAIEQELANVRAAAEVPALDYDYLTGGGQAFTDALGAVLALEEPGVRLINAEAVDVTAIDVRIGADSHAAALDWRRVAALLDSVDRVATFDPSEEDGQIFYNAVLILAGDGA